MLKLSVDVSVCIVSAWSCHGVVHLKLPARSSKLHMLYGTNSALKTHTVIYSMLYMSPSHDWTFVNGMERKRKCIQCIHFHVKGSFHGDGRCFSFCPFE